MAQPQKVKANIVITAKIDLEEFNMDIDEVPDIVKEYLEDLLYDIEGLEPVKILVRTI
jgi:hypothetical protein|tara:strand:- start:165 stop:338 length:174 start_codon:yes stop_codon:yes gene_type:complete